MHGARIVSWALAALLLLGACGGGDGGEGTPQPGADGATPAKDTYGGEQGGGRYGYGLAGDTIELAGQPANDHGAVSAGGKQRLAVELDDFYFEPTVITGAPGQTLILHLVNEGSAAHTFTLEAEGLDVELGPGERAQAEVSFPSSGLALFFCRFHAGAGMRGALRVS